MSSPPPAPDLPPLRAGVAWVGTAVMVALMAILVEQLNPDWFGYEQVYREGGSWLLDQGRDPLFVFLIGSFSSILGAEGYPLFRLILGAAFAVFTYALLRGRLLPFAIGHSRGVLLLAALLPLLVPRFTVQIREGMAMTLVVVSMAWLLRMEQSAAVQAPQAQRVGVLGALVWLAMAYAIHAGTVLIILSLAAALLIAHFAGGSRRIENHLLLALALLLTCTTGLLAAFVPNTTWGVRTIAGTFGWLVDGRTSMSFDKWIYWLVYGLGIFTLIARVLSLGAGSALGSLTRPFASVMAMVCLPALYVCALILLASGVPPIVVSALARSINLLVALLLLLVAFRGRLGVRLGLFAALVLVDQARIIREAVLNTLGELA